MTKPYLTDEEIASITEPLTQGAARCRYFEKIGCKVVPKPNGQPHVGRAEYEAAMMAKNRARTAQADAGASSVVTPDWTALRERQSRKSGPRAA